MSGLVRRTANRSASGGSAASSLTVIAANR
jgi:hypothetical protein